MKKKIHSDYREDINCYHQEVQMVLLNLKLTPKKNTYDILRKRKLCLNGLNSARWYEKKKIHREKGIF